MVTLMETLQRVVVVAIITAKVVAPEELVLTIMVRAKQKIQAYLVIVIAAQAVALARAPLLQTKQKIAHLALCQTTLMEYATAHLQDPARPSSRVVAL